MVFPASRRAKPRPRDAIVFSQAERIYGKSGPSNLASAGHDPVCRGDPSAGKLNLWARVANWGKAGLWQVDVTATILTLSST